MDDAIEKRLSEIEANQKEIFARLNAVEKSSGVLVEKLDNIKDSQKEIKESLKEFQKTLQELSMKPAKRWDSFIGYIIAAVVSSGVTILIAQIVK